MMLPGVLNLKYNLATVGVTTTTNVWALRKSEILQELQMEVDEDYNALKLDKQIRREQNKETFEERWLLKFKEWLGDNCFWDEKKFCYTLILKSGTSLKTYDFYPKANKVFIKQENRWQNRGVQWLLKNVLPMQYQEARPY